jgi:hypothetical protein
MNHTNTPKLIYYLLIYYLLIKKNICNIIKNMTTIHS